MDSISICHFETEEGESPEGKTISLQELSEEYIPSLVSRYSPILCKMNPCQREELRRIVDTIREIFCIDKEDPDIGGIN